MASLGANRGHQRPTVSGNDGRRSLLLEVLSEAEVIDLGLDGTVDDLPPMTTRLLSSNLYILQAICWLIYACRLGTIIWCLSYPIYKAHLLYMYYSITITAISLGLIEYFAYRYVSKANTVTLTHHQDAPSEYTVDYEVTAPVQQDAQESINMNVESGDSDFTLIPWVTMMCIMLSIVTHMCIMLEMLFLCYAYYLPSPMFLCSTFTIFLSNGPIMMILQLMTLPCVHPVALSDRSTFLGCIPLLSPLSVIRVTLNGTRRILLFISSFFKKCLLYIACQAHIEQWGSSCRRACSRIWNESRFFQGVSNSTFHNNRRSRLFQPSQEMNSHEFMKEYETGLENTDHFSRTLSYDNTKASASIIVDGDEYESSSSDNVVECVTPLNYSRRSLQSVDITYASCSETLQVANSCLLLDMSAACLFVKTYFLPLVEVETHEFLSTIISLLRLFSGDICLLLYLFFGLILEPHPLFYVLLSTTAIKLLLQVSSSLVANLDSIIALWCLETE